MAKKTTDYLNCLPYTLNNNQTNCLSKERKQNLLSKSNPR